jgi:hypothetical protein
MQFKMFHRPKPRQFNYKPIYFDPEKEKKQAAKEEMGELRAKFREETRRVSQFGSNRKKINLTIYLVIIALLLYFIFFS